ncbi:MAG: hypothetical protein RIC29_08520 [Rhodospirillaceae bacterium]
MSGPTGSHWLRNLSLSALTTLAVCACGETENSGTIDIKIIEREDFTYSAGYSNGCRFKVQVINNTEIALSSLDVFATADDEFLFSISSELPVNGASIRTHDVQQNQRCNEFSNDVKLKKNHCTLGTLSEAECFDAVQIVPADS